MALALAEQLRESEAAAKQRELEAQKQLEKERDELR
jgi:hypothetical protein